MASRDGYRRDHEMVCPYDRTLPPSEYHDIDGNPVSLFALVRREPEWAVSQIRATKLRKTLWLAKIARVRAARMRQLNALPDDKLDGLTMADHILAILEEDRAEELFGEDP